MNKDMIGSRMKENYENVSKTKLLKKVPVAIRIDGKAFHTFTKGFQKPFDEVLMKSMQETMKYLCENIQGCVFGYTQSDEITLILIDYQTLNSSAYFDYEVQKLCSISASMATMAFNKFFKSHVEAFEITNTRVLGYMDCEKKEQTINLIDSYYKAIEKGAMFDARCFNIPKEEVANLIYWRQIDATRNSIQMVGQANFTHKELQHKTSSMIQDMLHESKGINWNNYPASCKRGSACIKIVHDIRKDGKIIRPYWEIDEDMPIIKGENREYVEQYIFVGEE